MSYPWSFPLSRGSHERAAAWRLVSTAEGIPRDAAFPGAEQSRRGRIEEDLRDAPPLGGSPRRRRGDRAALAPAQKSELQEQHRQSSTSAVGEGVEQR